ncbi:hypothetical protein A45J_1005 [hot springs metagenome]|uniref:protein-glutamate O-methyltransferase n=1 Tax=hot springs metagenome TaxID=433727 RepID=A0A5J4L4W1_9ZZZZ
MGLTPFKNLFRDKCGFCFNDIRDYNLEKGVRSRMESTGSKSYEDYYLLVTSDKEEFNSLVNFITVNETYFYREPFHLHLFVERLIPELLQTKNSSEKIRILSAGCSTGEEPYSILMAVLEKFGNSALNKFYISAVDIDRDAVYKAKEGIYSNFSFRTFPVELKDKYFFKLNNGGYRIKDKLRNNVNFYVFNLLNNIYPTYLCNMDVIFYRNVSIYFESDVQKRIFEKLSEVLNPDGLIIVSATETMAHNIGTMRLEEIDGVFVYRKSEIKQYEANIMDVDRSNDFISNACPANRISQTIKKPSKKHIKIEPPCESESRQRHESKEKIDCNALFNKALSMANDKRYDDALKAIDEILNIEPYMKKANTLKASILLNRRQFDEAEHICHMNIQRDRWCLESILLLGIISKIKEDYDAAINRFKEAVYISSSCWLAHFYLAELHRDRGDLNKSCKEYEIAMNLIKKTAVDGHGLTFFPLTFSAEEIAHLCRHNLQKLKKAL